MERIQYLESNNEKAKIPALPIITWATLNYSEL